MTKKKSQKEVVLDGTNLSNDDILHDLVTGFKASLAESGNAPVILDLSRINALYSKGISVILGLFKDCKAADREFCVNIANDDILNLLRMLKLDKVITVRKVEP